MILDKEIKIKICNKEQIEHYGNRNYNPEWKKFLFVKINDLTSGSNVLINVKCDICGNEKQLSYVKYIKNTKNLTEPYCCCNKCSLSKQEKTCFENNGVKYPAQNKIIYAKVGKTNIKKYGGIAPMCDNIVKNKLKKTCEERYGFSSSNQNEEVKTKMRKTLFEKYGVEHPTQNREIFSKQQKTSFKILIYKNTNLTYQGSYEKYFLEQIDEKGLLHKVLNGKSYNYILNEKKHVYHSDYWFNDSVIEIKSTWTFNRNGKDKNLELKNEAKIKTVKESGENIFFLKSKKEINEFINNI